MTADQKLYRVAVDILWDNPGVFGNMNLRLGGMHLLMSYVGSIGTPMQETGFEEVLSAAFGGVKKMLIGKTFPDNVRALRMMVEELLRPIFNENSEISTMDDLLHTLEERSRESRTARMWLMCIIKPVFAIMKYVRAEKVILHYTSLQ